MALADTKASIGAVSELLLTQLSTRTSVSTVDIGRPEVAAGSNGPKFNLFLYQVDIDGHMRNHSLDNGQVPPLWLVLRYLLTAFDDGKESDSAGGHKLLGEGMLALHELNFLRPSALALVENPEPLKITFDSADSELLSKLMQGSDEKYRISAAFQIRPVMIAPSVPPRYSLPVKTVGPPGNEGVIVLPTLGPRLVSVIPEKLTSGTEITLKGLDVGLETGTIRIGDTDFAVSNAKSGEIKTTIPIATTLSAGNYPVAAVRSLVGGKELVSNCLLMQLLPTVSTATPGVPGPLVNNAGKLSGDLTITGRQLGGPDDRIYVAFYWNGEVQLMLQTSGTALQTSLTMTVSVDDALPASDYYIILRVNGVQAANAPKVSWV